MKQFLLKELNTIRKESKWFCPSQSVLFSKINIFFYNFYHKYNLKPKCLTKLKNILEHHCDSFFTFLPRCLNFCTGNFYLLYLRVIYYVLTTPILHTFSKAVLFSQNPQTLDIALLPYWLGVHKNCYSILFLGVHGNTAAVTTVHQNHWDCTLAIYGSWKPFTEKWYQYCPLWIMLKFNMCHNNQLSVSDYWLFISAWSLGVTGLSSVFYPIHSQIH